MVKIAFESFCTLAMFHAFRHQLTAGFINEVIRASTRHHASQDLHSVNVLSALAASKRVPSISVYKGNYDFLIEC